MPVAIGAGRTYLWRDGSTSSLAPPSDAIDVVLQNPTEWAVENGTAVNYDKLYRSHEFIGAACRFRAGQLARVSLKTFIRSGDDKQRDDTSVFARLLRRPAPRRTAHQLKRAIELDLCVNGNHLEEIVRERGRPPELRPIQWGKAKPKYNVAKTRIDGWEVWDQGPGEKPRTLSNFEVIHFAAGSTNGPLGVSMLEHLGIALTVDRAATAHQLSTLRNGARTGIVVVIDPAHAKDPDLKETIRSEFEARYSGAINSGRPVIAGGIDVKHLSQQSLVDAELIKTRQISREAASAVTQVPTLFLGDLGKATMNNYAEAHRQLFKTTLAEPMDFIPEVFAAQLLDEHPDLAPEGTYCEFDPNSIVWGDPLERAKTYREMLACGALTINDIRALENRPGFEGEWANLPIIDTTNFGNPNGADDIEHGPGDGDGDTEDDDESGE